MTVKTRIPVINNSIPDKNLVLIYLFTYPGIVYVKKTISWFPMINLSFYRNVFYNNKERLSK